MDELDGTRWREQGSCAGHPRGGWFEDTRTPAAHTARRICARCPVRRRCLAASLLYGEEYGIWGGLDPEQRELLHARLRDGKPLRAVVDDAVPPALVHLPRPLGGDAA
ncbi:MAG TPA: WhiB family transcriptional regulator [Dermatophilaceae bacterium]|nr:WhiB family transcriptional regulator [Dermatophilaceae bacterium]